MRTLDIFRAVGRRRRAGLRPPRARRGAARMPRSARCSASTLADLQLTQAALGDMATAIDAAALLTYRAAWQRDPCRSWYRAPRARRRWPR
jgi:acyl-CoA dehydrogenase